MKYTLIVLCPCYYKIFIPSQIIMLVPKPQDHNCEFSPKHVGVG
uniref:Uncharacterized protein n=1 Tax=Arundo donax TaxID=35708 RepID=A0A0A9B7G5_ARUDO